MIYIKLLLTFMKIGLFSFGGGYAMIPMIEKEIEGHGWLSATEFFDIVAIAEMTPGPIAVNSATFVGYRTAGYFGGLIATIGVAIPSLVLILIISRYFFKFQKHPLNTAVFYGLTCYSRTYCNSGCFLFGDCNFKESLLPPYLTLFSITGCLIGSILFLLFSFTLREQSSSMLCALSGLWDTTFMYFIIVKIRQK